MEDKIYNTTDSVAEKTTEDVEKENAYREIMQRPEFKEDLKRLSKQFKRYMTLYNEFYRRVSEVYDKEHQ